MATDEDVQLLGPFSALSYEIMIHILGYVDGLDLISWAVRFFFFFLRHPLLCFILTYVSPFNSLSIHVGMLSLMKKSVNLIISTKEKKIACIPVNVIVRIFSFFGDVIVNASMH